MDPNIANTLANLNARLFAVEKHLRTDLPQYLDSYKQKMMLFPESVAGLLICQNFLFSLLVKDGVIKREDVGLFLDSVIASLDAKYPNNPNLTQPLKNLCESINKADPYQYPDWLQGMIGGNDPTEPVKE